MDVNSNVSFYIIQPRQNTRQGSESWFFWEKKKYEEDYLKT